MLWNTHIFNPFFPEAEKNHFRRHLVFPDISVIGMNLTALWTEWFPWHDGWEKKWFVPYYCHLLIHPWNISYSSLFCMSYIGKNICQLPANRRSSRNLQTALPHWNNISDPGKGGKNHRGMKAGKDKDVWNKLFVSSGVPKRSAPIKTRLWGPVSLPPVWPQESPSIPPKSREKSAHTEPAGSLCPFTLRPSS